MNGRFLAWAFLLAATFVVDGLCLRFLAEMGWSGGASLALRGGFCLVYVFLFSKWNRLSLIPKIPAAQARRALLAGLSLSLILWSYKYLSASAVAVLTSIDVPLLILFGAATGRATSPRMMTMAAAAIVLLTAAVLSLENASMALVGVVLAVTGSLLLCFGYLYIKKSMADENLAVTIFTPALAILLYGVMQIVLGPSPVPSHLSLLVWLAAAGTGATMFLAYYITVNLYELSDVATAESPTLLAGLLLIPLESLLFRTSFPTTYVFLSTAFVAVLLVMVFMRARTTA